MLVSKLFRSSSTLTNPPRLAKRSSKLFTVQHLISLWNVSMPASSKIAPFRATLLLLRLVFSISLVSRRSMSTTLNRFASTTPTKLCSSSSISTCSSWSSKSTKRREFCGNLFPSLTIKTCLTSSTRSTLESSHFWTNNVSCQRVPTRSSPDICMPVATSMLASTQVRLSVSTTSSVLNITLDSLSTQLVVGWRRTRTSFQLRQWS
mmetsp:Transcript_27543/g.45780  ORF Transcript_27543/g.45780 Transcript_27543/m.45780 type:complete len:206 (+) Transcript_27543:480-1097(+)